jgi:glycosyltransferase involved in cell wall biosynthesis
MNILYGRTDVNLAGPGIVMLKTSSELVKKGYSVTMVSSGGALENEFDSKGVNVIRIDELAINKRSILNTLHIIRSLRRIMLDYDINVVHGHNMLFTLLAYVAGKTTRLNVRFCTTIHGYGKEWLCKYIPGKVIVVSDFLKRHLLGFNVKENKIIVLRNGLIHLNDYKYDDTVCKPLPTNEKFKIISVAMMTGSKGHDQIIHVIEKICHLGYDVELLFIGEGIAKDRLVSKVEKKGLQDNIKFLGRRRDIPCLLLQSDIFLHLTDFETFGMVIMEAMAAGLPVVASNIGGIPELVDCGKNGYLVDNSDFDNIAKKIILLIDDKNKRDELGGNGLKKIEEKFLIRQNILNLEKIYRAKLLKT